MEIWIVILALFGQLLNCLDVVGSTRKFSKYPELILFVCLLLIGIFKWFLEFYATITLVRYNKFKSSHKCAVVMN